MKRLIRIAALCVITASLGLITGVAPVDAQTDKPESPGILSATYTDDDTIVVRFQAAEDPDVVGFVVNLDGSRLRTVEAGAEDREFAIPPEALTAGVEHVVFIKAITDDGTLSRHSNRARVRVDADHPFKPQSPEREARIRNALLDIGCNAADAERGAKLDLVTIDELLAFVDTCTDGPEETPTTTTVPTTTIDATVTTAATVPITLPPPTEPSVTAPPTSTALPTTSGTITQPAPLPAPTITSAVHCGDLDAANITFLFASTVTERTRIIPTVNGHTFDPITLLPNRNDYGIEGASIVAAGVTRPFSLQLQVATDDAVSPLSEARTVTVLRCSFPPPTTTTMMPMGNQD